MRYLTAMLLAAAMMLPTAAVAADPCQAPSGALTGALNGIAASCSYDGDVLEVTVSVDFEIKDLGGNTVATIDEGAYFYVGVPSRLERPDLGDDAIVVLEEGSYTILGAPGPEIAVPVPQVRSLILPTITAGNGSSGVSIRLLCIDRDNPNRCRTTGPGNATGTAVAVN